MTTIEAGIRTPDRPKKALVVAAAAAALAGIAIGAMNAPPQSLFAAFAALLVALTFFNPAAGGWTWLLAAPLIVGVARGGGLAVLRPNEALLIVIAAAVALNGLSRWAQGLRVYPRLAAIDLAMLGLVVTGSAMPLLLRYGRGLPVTPDDVLYALVFVKYFLLFALFRMAVRSEAEVRTSLKLVLVSAAVVAVVAVLQVRNLLNVPAILSAYYDSPFEGSTGATVARGSSTIASAFGLADMMAMCLAIVIAWLATPRARRVLLVGGGGLFLLGCIAAGSFSGFIACGVVVLAAGFAIGRLAKLLALVVPAALVAAIGVWPVIAGRLAGFETRLSLPQSWLGRLENLERFFWPELFSGVNWLLGVRPAARVPAPETWRDWVYIESGYTWLLWTGGVALVVAFMAFAAVVLRDTLRIARAGSGAVSVAAAAGFAAMAMMIVLMLFDPHLTVRGAADLFFPLLALAFVKCDRSHSRLVARATRDTTSTPDGKSIRA